MYRSRKELLWNGKWCNRFQSNFMTQAEKANQGKVHNPVCTLQSENRVECIWRVTKEK